MIAEFDHSPLALMTIGRTAAGKTTLAKSLAQRLGADYVSESAVKRALRSGYSTEDCLDESLRDRAYRVAIEDCVERLRKSPAVILDAAFHRAFRRRWAVDAFTSVAGGIVALYVFCNDRSKTEERIASRRDGPRDAFTHADSMAVYDFVNSMFEEPSETEFASPVPSCLMCINTDLNRIERVWGRQPDAAANPWWRGLESAVSEQIGLNALDLRPAQST